MELWFGQMHASKCFHCANSNLMSFDFEFDVNESSNDSPQKNNWPFNNGVMYCEWKTRDGRFQQLQAVCNFCETIVQLSEKISIIKKHIYVKKGASEILQQSEGKPKCKKLLLLIDVGENCKHKQQNEIHSAYFRQSCIFTVCCYLKSPEWDLLNESEQLLLPVYLELLPLPEKNINIDLWT